MSTSYCGSISRAVLEEKYIENGSRRQLLDQNFQYDVLSLLSIIEKLHATRESERRGRTEGDALIRQKDQKISQLEVDLRKTLAELKDARGQITNQMAEIDALKLDLRDLESKMQMVQGIVQNEMEKFNQDQRNRLAFLNDRGALTRKHSKRLRPAASSSPRRASTPDSDSGDYTEGSMDLIDERPSNVYHRQDVNIAPIRRRSRSAHNLTNFSGKRSRSKAFDPVIEDEVAMPRKRSNLGAPMNSNMPSTSNQPMPVEITTTLMLDPAGIRQSRAKTVIRRSLNRSFSADDLMRDTVITGMTGGTATTSTVDLRRVPAVSWTKGMSFEDRRHTLQKLSGFLKPVYCEVCCQRITFISRPPPMVCSDCHVVVHVSCKSKLPLPCIPRSSKIPKRREGMRLTDFCPSSSPMIPYPVIQMVVALERKGLNIEGLYRVPSMKKQRDSLLAMFKDAKNPPLDKFDSDVIADTLKMFLREFKDPVIPRSSRDEFVNAVRRGSRNALNTAIYDLPHPHCDTLAYLCIHWIHVAEQFVSNKMPVENIARCVAPSVIGQLTHEDLAHAVPETRQHEAVMVALLKKPEVFGGRFLNAILFQCEWRELLDMAMQGCRDRTPTRSAQTPRNRASAMSPSSHNRSVLGPITPCGPSQQVRSRPMRLFDDIR